MKHHMVLDPAAPVHVAAGIADHAARTDSIVELLVGMAKYPEHRHLKECIRKPDDEGA